MGVSGGAKALDEKELSRSTRWLNSDDSILDGLLRHEDEVPNKRIRT